MTFVLSCFLAVCIVCVVVVLIVLLPQVVGAGSKLIWSTFIAAGWTETEHFAGFVNLAVLAILGFAAAFPGVMTRICQGAEFIASLVVTGREITETEVQKGDVLKQLVIIGAALLLSVVTVAISKSM